MNPSKFAFSCLLAFCLTMPLFGQNQTSPDKKTETQKVKFDLKKRRIEQLYAFMDENHPELKQLLLTLEDKKKWQYKQAMMGLDRAVKKLENIKQRSPKRYEMGLKQWNIESRITMAAAQVKLKDNEKNRDKLKSLVTQLVDFHLERMKSDKEQVISRLKQLEKRIADAESNREEAIEKRVKSATRRSKKAKKSQ
ncbi:hypothetical protein [Mariniblastus fucicola]|uniref:Uncharacterized protein n=1 Tax=Mariniblastus fucicola TaxID=980251 RepID=A0A5B9PJZ1_9BACT|nr:hypothetical protein [Mariniblastus fucicola]QEG25042.1 hypothetical protein MFFC18_49650 [Mariniblastus fucicola]